MDAQFGHLEGVIRTRSGYAGGTKANPSYYDLGDHSEAVQVDYDPQRITYEELAAVFWDSHDPTSQPLSTQYQNVLFYTAAEEERIALAARDRLAAELGAEILTRIEPLETFYRAEDYHQKYYLRSEPILSDYYQGIYPDAQAFADSTATARVNGYLAGHGTRAQLDAEAEALGLVGPALERLRALVPRR